MSEEERKIPAIHRILKGRDEALKAGLLPVAVRVGWDVRPPDWTEGYICGLRLTWGACDDGAVEVLALPNRKIGRYEVVCPTVFPA